MSKTRRKSKNSGGYSSCLMFILVYWWFYPLKWMFYDIPKWIISSISHIKHDRDVKMPDIPPIEYVNNKKYGDYAVTQTGYFSVNGVENQIEAYKKQALDRKHICESTTDPLTFFYSYDFMIKRYIDIISMSHYTKIPEVYATYASGECSFAIQFKQKAVKALIERCSSKSYDKIKSLKTVKAKMKYADLFQMQFEDFADEISSENRQLIMDSSEYLHFVATK